jgi:chromosome segregation ATPase
MKGFLRIGVFVLILMLECLTADALKVQSGKIEVEEFVKKLNDAKIDINELDEMLKSGHRIRKRNTDLQQNDLSIETLENNRQTSIKRIKSFQEQLEERKLEIKREEERMNDKIKEMERKANETAESNDKKLQTCKLQCSENQEKASKLDEELQKVKIATKNCEKLLKAANDRSANEDFKKPLTDCQNNLATSSLNLDNAKKNVSILQSELDALRQTHNSTLITIDDEKSKLKPTLEILKDEKEQISREINNWSGCDWRSDVQKYNDLFDKPPASRNIPTLSSSKFAECL